MEIIIVKDYLYEGNHIVGVPYDDDFEGKIKDEDYFVLDDGDIYTLKQLKESDYKVIKITSNEIIEKFKNKLEEE